MKMKPFVIFGVAVLASLVPTPPASAQDSRATGCETQSALLLIDESGSLGRSDPSARRVDAAKLVVEALSPQAAGRPPVNLTIAGFGSSYATYADLQLPSGRDAALAEVESFRDRTSQKNTDYVAALRAASAHFAGIDGPEQCKTLLWFTDGGHDVEFPSESDAATYTRATDPLEITRQLESLVCGPLPDSALLTVPVREEIVRARFRTVISELRAGTPSGHQQERLDITYPVLNRLVRAPGDSCQVPGSWTTVSKPEELASQLFGDAQAALGRQAVDCSLLTGGRLRSDIVRSVAFRLEGSRSASFRVGGEIESLTGSVFERDVSPEARPVGSQLQVSGSGGVVDCFAELDAELRLVTEPVLFKGATETAVDLVVAGPDFAEERSVDPALVQVRVSVDGKQVRTIFDVERGVWTAYLPGSTATALNLSAVASVGEELEIARLQTEIRVSDLPPAPAFSWAGASEMEGTGVLAGGVRVTPLITVESAEYCVTFPDETNRVHAAGVAAAVAELRVRETERCGPATAGASFDVPAEVVVEHELNGTMALQLRVASTYRDPSGAELTVGGDAPVDIGRVALVRAPDRVREALVVAILLAASCVFPLLLLWLFNARHGRLQPPSTLAALPLKVELERWQHPQAASPEHILRRSARHEIKLADLGPVRGSRRRWQLPGGFTVERRLPLNPFGNPSSVIAAPNGHLVSSIAATRADGTVTGPIRVQECVLVDMPATAPEGDEILAVSAVVVAEQGRTVPQLEEMLATALQRCGPHIRLVEDQTSQSVGSSGRSDAGSSAPRAGARTGQPPAPPARSGPPPAPPVPSGPTAGTSGAPNTPPPAPSRNGVSPTAPPSAPAPSPSPKSPHQPPPAPPR